MPRQKSVMPSGKRPPRAAAATSQAINNVLLGKRNVGPALAALAVTSSSSQQPSFVSGRPRPSGGIGVKNMQVFRKRNKDIKIKKLLPQSRVVNVNKNGVVVRKLTDHRRAYFPGRHKKVY